MGEGASTWINVGYLVAVVCFILALKGLSSPRTARIGNLVGAAGAVLAIVLVFVAARPDNVVPILIALVVGGLIGAVAARRVAMTGMPQMVAVFNGVGGGAAVLVALSELSEVVGNLSRTSTGAFTMLVGGVTFSGSLVTFAKLQGMMTSRPIIPPQVRLVWIGSVLAALVLGAFTTTVANVWLGIALSVVALALGVLLVLPVGGADVPIVISLLNAFSGVSVATSGYLLGNTLMLVSGTLVGAAGMLLTQMMAKAMGRSVVNILFGALRGDSTLGSTEESSRPVRSAKPEDIAILLGYAQRVIVVPGYGLAVAQAQHALRELAEVLAERGTTIDYAIHPVAGRMPGHMNVLLAEANVPYAQLKEMDAVNPEFKTSDVALIVGANDVVNPAARNAAGTPISGMPILNADQSQAIVFLKRSMRPGFAGIENDLLYDPKTTLLFGDAKESLTKLVVAVKGL